MRRVLPLIALTTAQSADPVIAACEAQMSADAPAHYQDYCAERCALWASPDFGQAFCTPAAATDASVLTACVLRMEAACSPPPGGAVPPQDGSGNESPPDVDYPEENVPATEPATTSQRAPLTTTSKATTSTRTTSTSKATTVKATTSTAKATTSTSRATTSTAKATTAKATTTPASPNLPSGGEEVQIPVGEPGFHTAYDTPDSSVDGAVGPNGECIWAYTGEGVQQGTYAGVANKVYRAKQWAEASQKPGQDTVWEYIQDCSGTAPKVWTLDAMKAAVKDSSKATFFYDPWTPAAPSKEEIAAVEAAIAQDPQVRILRDAARVLPADEIEAIAPGAATNPENVKRVETFLTSETFEQIFPFRHVAYSYENYLKAVGAFPDYCKTYEDGRDSDAICKKLVAASFAHYSQETGANAPAWTINRNDCGPDNTHPEAAQYFDPDTPIPRFLQGLYWLRETAFSGSNAEAISDSGYEKCDPKGDQPWSLVFPCSDEVTYYGRGSKQLSWNYNYGLFSKAMYGDATILLNEPRSVAETWLNFASGIWFAVTPQSPKPPMTWALDGTWTGSPQDLANGLAPGFGATIEIINGGYECRGTNEAATHRAEAYENFMNLFGLQVPADEPSTCNTSKGFPTDSPVSTKLYWTKDWSHPFACKQDTVQSPFTVVQAGDYGRCVDFNWRSHVMYNGAEIMKNGDSVW